MFDPSPILLAFLFVQRFVFLPVLGLLALARLVAGRGWVRLPAALVLALCLAATLTVLAPALDLQSSSAYPRAARLLAQGGGMTAPLVAAALFLPTVFAPRRRWRWLDAAFLLLVLVYLGLWAATRV